MEVKWLGHDTDHTPQYNAPFTFTSPTQFTALNENKAQTCSSGTYNITLNIPTCFDLQVTINGEPKQSNIT